MAILKDDITEKNIGKKSPRGRKRFRSISTHSISVRPFNGDLMYVKKVVKELRLNDPNFASDAAALRHYIHVGIAAEIAISDLRKSLDNNIIKRSLKAATFEELKPIANHLENLINAVESLIGNQEINFNDIARRTNALEAKLEAVYERLKTDS